MLMHNKQERAVTVITHNAQISGDSRVMTKMGNVTKLSGTMQVNKLKSVEKIICILEN